MRYVNPARSLSEQNLVACQNGRDIYFYTIRPVEPKQELLVWYSREFAQRLCSQQDDIKQSEYSRSRELFLFVIGDVNVVMLVSIRGAGEWTQLMFGCLECDGC